MEFNLRTSYLLPLSELAATSAACFNINELGALPTKCVYVFPYASYNKQQLFH